MVASVRQDRGLIELLQSMDGQTDAEEERVDHGLMTCTGFQVSASSILFHLVNTRSVIDEILYRGR